MDNCKKYKLTDIADVERAKIGQTYPKGTIFIQVSATNGQIKMLDCAGPIESKYATIIPKKKIYPSYFKLALERMVPEFLSCYKSNLNIQIDDFKFFEVYIHEDPKTQMEISQIMDQWDKAEESEQAIVDALMQVKRLAQAKMFV